MQLLSPTELKSSVLQGTTSPSVANHAAGDTERPMGALESPYGSCGLIEALTEEYGTTGLLETDWSSAEGPRTEEPTGELLEGEKAVAAASGNTILNSPRRFVAEMGCSTCSPSHPNALMIAWSEEMKKTAMCPSKASRCLQWSRAWLGDSDALGLDPAVRREMIEAGYADMRGTSC